MALIKYSEANKTTANAYIDQTYMTAFLADRIKSTATASYNESDEKDQYIIFATQRIDMMKHLYKGDRADVTQRLAFPRSNIEVDDYDIDDTTIPDGIERATAEMVLFLIENSITTVNEDVNFKRTKVGSLEVEYKDSQTASPANASLNPVIKGLLQPFMMSGTKVYKG